MATMQPTNGYGLLDADKGLSIDAPMEDMEIIMEEGATDDLPSLEEAMMDMVEIDPETGEIVVTTLDFAAGPAFGDNLAEYMDEADLASLGKEVVDKVEEDLRSRKPWYDRYVKGLQALGVYNADSSNEVLGTAEISHPLILEAGTQFQARAMSELFPATGPVKGAPIGDLTPAKFAIAERGQTYMNYQLTVEDRTYYDEQDLKYFRLPFSGSEFDKQYFCPIKKRNVSRWVRAENFVMSYYSPASLEDTPCYTEIVPMPHNDYRKLVRAGFYKDCELGEGSGEKPDGIKDVERVISDMQGEIKPATEINEEHTFYEQYVDKDLKGFEDPDGIALPYIITVDKDSSKVVGIRRNWRERDEDKKKRVWHTHKKFLPGFGAYGFGFIHVIGGLGEAATKILNILIDSGAFATLQGGFKSKDCKIKGEVTLTPGEWKDTEMTAEELAKSFYTPPFKEPSPVMNAVLGLLVDSGRRFAATTEVQVGDAATTGPVGTTVALIEQGSKVFSGIHKRIHKALGDEFMHLAELNGEHLPEVYPYETATGEQHVLKADFDARIDWMPVSDPNIFSSAQRIAMAQAGFQMAQGMPDIADRREAGLQVLKAMRFADPESILPKPATAETADPLTEGVLATLGRPLKAILTQNHQAHNMIHQMQMQQLPPPAQASMQAHIVEHTAMGMYLQAQQMFQTQLPPMNWGAKPNEQMTQPLPPEIEAQIAMQAAQQAQQMMQQQQQQAAAAEQAAQQPPPQQQEDPRIAEAEFAAKEQRKNQSFELDQQRKNAALAADVDRKDAMEGLSPALVKSASQFIAETGIQMSPRELALLAKVTGKPFIEVVSEVSRMLSGGQGAGPIPIVSEFAGRQQGYS